MKIQFKYIHGWMGFFAVGFISLSAHATPPITHVVLVAALRSLAS